jgi:outer membrane lipoprotein LolB
MRSGRLAVRVEAQADQPANQISAGFELNGDAREGRLRLLSPIGTVIAEAAWVPGEASLRSSSEDASRYDSLADLTQAIFGTELPIAAMFAWIEGHPWGLEPALSAADGFSQLGWQVNTSALAGEGLLTAEREAAPRVNLRIRLDR